MRKILPALVFGAVVAMAASPASALVCIAGPTCPYDLDGAGNQEFHFSSIGTTDYFTVSEPGDLFIWLDTPSDKFLVDVTEPSVLSVDFKVYSPGAELIFNSTGTFDISVELVSSADPMGSFDLLPLDSLNPGDPFIAGSNPTLTRDVVATPLPSTWLMLLAGLIGLGFFAYRGKKRCPTAFSAV